MLLKKIPFLVIVIICIGALFYAFTIPVNAQNLQQQPTGSLPTVTSTSIGPVVTIRTDLEEFANVRSGPGVFFDKIGVLLPGQKLPAKGKTAGGDWVVVEYLGVPGGIGWVNAHYVNVSPGDLPIIESPSTPTPLYTATIDPTLAAQFIYTQAPTQLATFTPPVPLNIPTYSNSTSSGGIGGKIPMGLVIIILGGVGILLAIFSFSQSR